jgi:hypothetical protein
VYILIDLNLRDVELEEPDDTHRFHVSVAHGDDYAKVADVLSEKDVGYVDADDTEEHAWIAVDAVQELAGGRTKHGWEEHFDKMLDHAAKHGWLSADRSHLKAHLDWIDVDGV